LKGSRRGRAGAESERRFVHRRRAGATSRHPVERGTPPDSAAEERPKVPDRGTKGRRSGRDRRDEGAWQPVSIDDAGSVGLDADAALVTAAADARMRAQAPYSHFMVGAALETSEGLVIGGCNIENATYGLTLCAERVALVKALSDGHSIFTRLAVVADTEAPTPPCGPCRQLLWEYCGDIDIILGNLNGPTGRFRLSALLPMPFDRRLLG
jgi:cytidine deaminase